MHEKKSTILVVDDEPHIQKMLGIILETDNFKIVESDCGKQAIRLCAVTKPDLVLLDLTLQDMDGKEVLSAIREWSQVPVIILSVRSDDEEITAALNLGANDYITKPFNIGVLLARIKASLRVLAVRETGDAVLNNGHVRMDLVRHEVFLHEERCAFTPKEYDVLRHFMVNRGKMLTHKEILKKIWGVAHMDDITYLRVYIGQIREKIEANPTMPTLIITEPGIGYRMEVLPDTINQAA
ncbi:MAG: response regulator [Alphaproteobacteria bacterium]